jgi:hypothetical protein
MINRKELTDLVVVTKSILVRYFSYRQSELTILDAQLNTNDQLQILKILIASLSNEVNNNKELKEFMDSDEEFLESMLYNLIKIVDKYKTKGSHQ